ncbi:MAG: hypothetical protein ABSE48_08460 [Verrucomicrobiota bacterium]|jgi:hypothetical protein
MKNKNVNSQLKKVSLGLMAGVLAPSAAWACACGCGIFEVGTSAMFPESSGGMAFTTYAFQNQNENWSDSSKAPAANNPDKNITTSFLSSGVEYMFNRSWGAEVEIPFAYRSFTTETANPNPPPSGLATMKWWSLGDIRIHAIYTGFSDDLSSGIDFGLKLPTGNFSQEDEWNDIDRDSEIGTGSTDVLLGGFHRGNLIDKYRLDWFVQAEADLPTLTQGEYRPGFEFDSAAGINYRGFSIGRANIAPLAQVFFAERTRDIGNDAAGGANDSPPDGINSGYTRVLVSPGVEIHIHPVKIYADVEVPVFVHTTGNQLVAPYLFKCSVSYMF